jgi:hypothetical protein
MSPTKSEHRDEREHIKEHGNSDCERRYLRDDAPIPNNANSEPTKVSMNFCNDIVV